MPEDFNGDSEDCACNETNWSCNKKSKHRTKVFIAAPNTPDYSSEEADASADNYY